MLAADDLKITATTGVRVNPFNRRFSLNRRTSVNYMLSAVHAGER